jgi:hypothetical protein
MTYPLELEGTWEEILTHASELAGQRVRLTVLPSETDGTPTPKSTPTLAERRALLRLPLAERQRILAEQAEILADYYQQDGEWKEFLTGDIVEY